MNSDETKTPEQLSLINRFRELWRLYILWTRQYIVNTACGFENSALITSRMVNNDKDLALLFRRYYDYEDSLLLEQLLNKQFLLSAKLVDSVKLKDSELKSAVKAELIKNTDDIASFFSSINPYWSKDYWQQLLYEQLYMLEYEGTCRYLSQYNSDAAIYQVIDDQARALADYMAQGIISQYKI